MRRPHGAPQPNCVTVLIVHRTRHRRDIGICGQPRRWWLKIGWISRSGPSSPPYNFCSGSPARLQVPTFCPRFDSASELHSIAGRTPVSAAAQVAIATAWPKFNLLTHFNQAVNAVTNRIRPRLCFASTSVWYWLLCLVCVSSVFWSCKFRGELIFLQVDNLHIILLCNLLVGQLLFLIL